MAHSAADAAHAEIIHSEPTLNIDARVTLDGHPYPPPPSPNTWDVLYVTQHIIRISRYNVPSPHKHDMFIAFDLHFMVYVTFCVTPGRARTHPPGGPEREPWICLQHQTEELIKQPHRASNGAEVYAVSHMSDLIQGCVWKARTACFFHVSVFPYRDRGFRTHPSGLSARGATKPRRKQYGTCIYYKDISVLISLSRRRIQSRYDSFFSSEDIRSVTVSLSRRIILFFFRRHNVSVCSSLVEDGESRSRFAWNILVGKTIAPGCPAPNNYYYSLACFEDALSPARERLRHTDVCQKKK